MENFKWSTENKTLILQELVKSGNYFLPAEVCSQKVDVAQVLSNVSEILKSNIVIQQLDGEIGDNSHCGIFIEKGAGELITIVYYYHLCNTFAGKMPSVSFINISKGEDGSLIIKDNNEKETLSWLIKLKEDIARFCGVEDLDDLEKGWTVNFSKKMGKSRWELTEFFENTSITITENVATYVGKNYEIELDGEMTINDLKKKFEDTFHAIPIFIKDKKECPENRKLEFYGITAPTIFKLSMRADVGKLCAEFRKEFNLEVYLKYMERKWAYILLSAPLNKTMELPSLGETIKNTILMKIAIKLD